MSKKIFILLLLLLNGLFARAQYTSPAVSDSINAALVDLSYDTLVQPYQAFYDSQSDLYVYISQVSGAQFLALSHSVGPNIFKFNHTDLIRAWHNYEIDNWILGATGTNYEGYSCETVIINRECTITISGDTWRGTASGDDDALGLAFYHFLIDPDFATYLQ